MMSKKSLRVIKQIIFHEATGPRLQATWAQFAQSQNLRKLLGFASVMNEI